jgi:uncharacterized membrane protein
MSNTKDTCFSNLDLVLIAIIISLLLISWGYLIIEYSSLPNIIAVHFDALGKPNGFSSKENIWFAPAIFSILSIAFIFGAKNQEAITFPKRKIGSTEKISNLKMTLYTALLLAVLCLIIVYTIIEASIIKNFEMPWLIPIIIGIVAIYIGVVFYYKFKTLKLS